MSSAYDMAVEVELSSGVTIQVTPLAISTLRALQEKAKDVIPYPDPETDPEYRDFVEYLEVADGEPQPFIREDKQEEWDKIVAGVDLARGRWAEERTKVLAIQANGQQDELIRQFAPELKRLAKHIDLPADKWEAVVTHCLLRRRSDRELVSEVIMDSLPLTAHEVRDSIRIFRIQVQGDSAGTDS